MYLPSCGFLEVLRLFLKSGWIQVRLLESKFIRVNCYFLGFFCQLQCSFCDKQDKEEKNVKKKKQPKNNNQQNFLKLSPSIVLFHF